VYPEGNLASQALGFVNADEEGQYGVEQFLNEELTGTPGLLQSVTDVRQIPLTIGAHDVSVPAKNGTNYVLSLDRVVQAEAERQIADGVKKVNSDSGSMIVMDATNGHVLAMANYPSYDVSKYQLVTDANLFQNSIVAYAFEPGSVFKTLTTAMSLDLGKITPNTTYEDTFCVKISVSTMCNAPGDEKFQGTNTMTQVLQRSLNTGVVWQLQQIGGGSITPAAEQTMYDYFSGRFRFGQTTNIQQIGESAGTIFTPDEAYFDQVRFANMAFGQGISVNLVQFAAAFASAVNGGVYYQPTLIDGTVDSGGTEKAAETKILNPQTISPSASTTLRDMIYTARQNSGLGRNDGGYYVGSKTGTAQVYDPQTGTYSTTKTIGTMVGFLADKNHDVKYVIMVRVNNDDPNSGLAGTTAANPVFTSMAAWLNQYEGVSK
jgi:cell division protein FtsI/penicillin-binding protein 2